MDNDRLSYSELLVRLADLHDRADRHAQALVDFNRQIQAAELELAKRQTPAQDWE